MRLHSVIFSLAAQVPFVALEYDPKVGGVAAMAGFQEFTLPFGGIEADVLARRMRQALHEKERFRELAGPAARDLRRRARENAIIAAELLDRGSNVTDYGPDARVLIGRLVMAQVAGTENLIGRLQALADALSHPVAGMRALEMADSLIGKAKEVQARIRELEEVQTQLAEARQESGRLRQQLQDGRLAVNTTRWHFETVQKRLEEETLRLTRELQEARRDADTAQELAGARKQQADAQIAILERRIAGYESKTFGGIAKRALQVVLDTFQLLTPGPLRAAFRKYYLNWFYFRIYPERRAGAASAQSRES
jgi:hypothetical protein